MNATLYVCTTCRAGESVEDPAGGDQPVERPVAGVRLHAAVLAEAHARAIEGLQGLDIAPVACLSACGNGCAVALSKPGCWSYVYGRLSEADAPDIVAGATAYAATSDGLVPWRERPQIFRKQSLARLPPQGCGPAPRKEC